MGVAHVGVAHVGVVHVGVVHVGVAHVGVAHVGVAHVGVAVHMHLYFTCVFKQVGLVTSFTRMEYPVLFQLVFRRGF